MKLQDYISVLTKRWWVIALTALVAVIVAYGVSKVTPKEYRAETTYLFTGSRLDNGLTITLQNTMNSYKESVLQPDPLEQISQDLHVDMSGEQLLQDVDMQALPDQQKMLIQVDNRIPEKAQQIANAVGKSLEAEVNRRNALFEGTDKINVQQIQQARLPAAPFRPNTRINVLAGAVLGLVLGLLLAFVLEFRDDTVKTSSDVERFVGLTMVGAIPTVENSKQKAEGRKQTAVSRA